MCIIFWCSLQVTWQPSLTLSWHCFRCHDNMLVVVTGPVLRAVKRAQLFTIHQDVLL